MLARSRNNDLWTDDQQLPVSCELEQTDLEKLFRVVNCLLFTELWRGSHRNSSKVRNWTLQKKSSLSEEAGEIKTDSFIKVPFGLQGLRDVDSSECRQNGKQRSCCQSVEFAHYASVRHGKKGWHVAGYLEPLSAIGVHLHSTE